MKKLPLIQSLWIGNKLSVMEKLSISSFLHNGHSFHLYVYDEVIGVPEGVTIKDASEIIPPDKIFKYKNYNSYAGFSDLFRYKLLLERGNYWVDTDVICLKPFPDSKEFVFASERLRKPSSINTAKIDSSENNIVTTCVIKAPSGSAILEYCYGESVNSNLDELEWGQIGPRFLNKAVNKYCLWHYVVRPDVFCPINWWDWNKFISVSPEVNILADSQAVHLWGDMWRRNNVDKSGSFYVYTVYEQLKKAYLNN